MKNTILILTLLIASFCSAQITIIIDQEKGLLDVNGNTIDIQNPTAPTNATANNITTDSAELSWTAATDNVGITNYTVYRLENSNYIFEGNTLNLTYTLTNLLVATTYSYVVTATDAANNESIYSNVATFQTVEPIDTTPPPSPQTFSVNNITDTTANLVWTFGLGDNNDTATYRIYNSGALLIDIQDTASIYTLSGLTPETAYSLTVRAVDGANNESTDSPVLNFTTEASTAPSNLNALYTFDNNVNDLANSNNGSTSGSPTYVTGLSNEAINLDGVDDYVSIPASEDLAFSTDFSISANIYIPNSIQSGWRAIVEHGRGTSAWYGLFKSASGNTFHFRWGQSHTTDFNTTVNPNTWYYVVVTYDGAVARMYLNNVLDKEDARASSLTATQGETRVGQNLSGSETFKGYIDDLRFYNEALTPTQISDLYNSYDFATDDQSPSIVTGVGTSNITQTTVDLTWDAATDNVGVTGYRIYDDSNNLLASVGNVTNHTLTGLNASTTYNIYVNAVDASGNVGINSTTVQFTTAAPSGTDTRFIMMGDSYTYSMYTEAGGGETQAVARINAAFPNETVEVYNAGSPGQTIESYDSYIDGVLPNYTNEAGKTTYCVVMLGVNDARLSRYSDLSQTAIDNKTAALNSILDKIEAKGFIPILTEAPWAYFDGTFNPNPNRPSYDDEENGTKPYNDNIIKPIILSRSATYAFADGQSFYQPYVRLYNGYDENPSFSDADGIHPSGTGYAHLKDAFVSTLVSYIFTGNAPTKLVQDGDTQALAENMPHEIDYFNAHYVSPANASSLQDSLDMYGAVRLGVGDYTSSGNITMTSNQRLYGWMKQNGTKLGGDINIAAGSTNVHIEDVEAENEIRFMAGAPITNTTVKSVYYSKIECIDCQMEDNTFIDLNRVRVELDCSNSGYFRNNTWVRVFAQSVNNHVIMIGNDVTPSYGNVELSRNLLNSSLSTSEYRNLDNHTLVGTDAEYWNSNSQPANAAWYMRDIGTLKFFNSFGYSSPPSFNASEFDIEADKIIMSRRAIGSPRTPRIRQGDLLYVEGDKTKPDLLDGAWGLFAHHDSSATDINETDVGSTLSGSDATKLNDLIYDTQKTPFARPNLPTLPNPTGANWATNRTGQADQSSTIQALIDANGIAELDEGIYYISQSLIIENGEGIVGKGTGKTAIVGITDDFPLILARDDVSSGQLTNVTYPLAYLTLQGGSKGLHIDPIGKQNFYLQITSWNLKNVVFRNQNYGIHFDEFYAVDNTFINCVNFVDCNIAWYQDALKPNPNGSGEYSRNMYQDKMTFHNCQFINNNTALYMNQESSRPNNLNSWVNCQFEGNNLVMDIAWNNAVYFANTDFNNNSGSYLFDGGSPISFYSCDFTNNSVSSLFDIGRVYAEGSNFNDATNFFNGSNKQLYLWNSNVTSTINTSSINQGVLINNDINGNAALSKPMVEIINGTPLTILDGSVDVYPQLLVKQ